MMYGDGIAWRLKMRSERDERGRESKSREREMHTVQVRKVGM